MDYELIETFLAVIETRNFTKAAEALHLSQPTISHRLKTLENILDFPLIERKKGFRSISLTPKGEEFINIAQRWMSLYKDTQNLQNSEPSLSLSIGCVDSLNVFIFPPLYKQLSNHRGLINLYISTHQSFEIFELVDNHKIDVGFVLRQVRYKNILIEPVFEEKMVLICRSDDNREKRMIHPTELNPKNELFLDWGSGFQSWHDYWWDPLIQPHAFVDTASLILNFMDNPHYWAIVPISIANSFRERENINVFELAEPPPNRVCYKITHRYPKSSSIRSLKVFDEYLKIFIENCQESRLFG